MRYVATAPTSGMFRVRYYQTPGESADVTLDFLYWVMARAPQPDLMPMAGIPKVLVLDKGPGNKSAAVKNVCAELGMDHRMHAAGHSWAKGSVEKHMDVWQKHFESQLMFWPAESLEELNRRAYEANIKFCNERRHTRHGKTRTDFYSEFIGEIKLPPPWKFL